MKKNMAKKKGNIYFVTDNTAIIKYNNAWYKVHKTKGYVFTGYVRHTDIVTKRMHNAINSRKVYDAKTFVYKTTGKNLIKEHNDVVDKNKYILKLHFVRNNQTKKKLECFYGGIFLSSTLENAYEFSSYEDALLTVDRIYRFNNCFEFLHEKEKHSPESLKLENYIIIQV